MKFLIITYDDYFNIPYIHNYETRLKAHGIDYDIILWNRSTSKATFQNHFLIFSRKDSARKANKLFSLLAWRRFVLRILKTGDYDKVIVLTTLPGVLLHRILTHRFRKRFWFDVRDFTYEHISLYKMLVADLVKNSLVTSVSSRAFMEFIPNYGNIVLAHNITNIGLSVPVCTLNPRKRPIVIGFVGGIQYQQQNEILLKQLENSEDFVLKYVGKVKPNCTLPQYCLEHGIRNAVFCPVYNNYEKPRIYQSIDLINCLYGNSSKITQLALPNKLYDCILFKKPILVSNGTYLSQIVSKYGIGLSLDIEQDPIHKKVLSYLDSFDPVKFAEGCNALLEIVQSEMHQFSEAIDQFCSEKGNP